MMDDMKLHDECGVFGIYSDADDQNVASSAYLALYALQHRGQMSCGIAVGDHGIIKSHKDNGLVPEVFSREVLDENDMDLGLRDSEKLPSEVRCRIMVSVDELPESITLTDGETTIIAK